MAWQVLPRLSGNVSTPSAAVVADGTISGGIFDGLPAATTSLSNSGVGTATVDEYSLVGTSPRLPPAVRGSNQPVIDLKAIGVQTFFDPGGTPFSCGPNDSFVYVIAINTWERETIGSFPAMFEVFLDTTGNSDPDYVVFNAPLSGPGTTGDVRTLTYVENLTTGDDSAFFFADHGTNDANWILPFCGDQIGLDATDFGQPIGMDVGAFDAYYTGNLTDEILGIKVEPLGERFLGLFGIPSDPGVAIGSVDIAPHHSVATTIVDFGATGTNPSETGVLMVLNASRGDVRGGAPRGRETLQIGVTGGP